MRVPSTYYGRTRLAQTNTLPLEFPGYWSPSAGPELVAEEAPFLKGHPSSGLTVCIHR